MQRVYDANRPHILANHSQNSKPNTYNFPTNNLENGIDELRDHLYSIDDNNNDKGTYKINLALGMILRHANTGEFRYFIPYRNEMLFDTPYVISRRANLRRLLLRLKKIDIKSYIERQRPNSKWNLFLLPILCTMSIQLVFR